MDRNPLQVLFQNLQSSTNCPISDEPTMRLAEKQMAIPNGQANWWHCSACQGWHLNLKNRHDPPSEASQ